MSGGPSVVLSSLPPFAAPPLRGGWCQGWGAAPPAGRGLDTTEPPRSTLRKIQGGSEADRGTGAGRAAPLPVASRRLPGEEAQGGAAARTVRRGSERKQASLRGAGRSAPRGAARPGRCLRAPSLHEDSAWQPSARRGQPGVSRADRSADRCADWPCRGRRISAADGTLLAPQEGFEG